jgi:hypothetical protein
MSTEKTSRRDFLRTAALAATATAAGRLADARSGHSVMGLRVAPMERVRIGIVGVGMRGSGAVRRLSQIEGVTIAALCDIRQTSLERGRSILARAGRPEAREYGTAPDAWKRLADSSDVDLVYICTPWDLHTPQAVYALRAGKHAASEVPAALTLDQCWELVETAEKAQRHCMMLENVCYGEDELLALNLCREGLLGELLHGEAAYIHDLRSLKMDDAKGYQAMWRLEHAKRRNGNLYPTHGLGPVAQYMGINRGDRFDSLVSMSTRERGLSLWAESHYGPEDQRRTARYALGDMNTSIIRTVRGRTILVQHDTTSPRPYSRLNLISGTKGIFAGFPPRLALEPKAHEWLKEAEFEEYRRKYQHPLWKRVGDEARRAGGHGGMDFVMDWRLVYCLRNGEPLDQSVYDAAAWSAVAPLSEWSVVRGGKPAKVPDFTRGAWQTAQPLGIVS